MTTDHLATHEDEALEADAQPPEVAAIEGTDAQAVPPDVGDADADLKEAPNLDVPGMSPPPAPPMPGESLAPGGVMGGGPGAAPAPAASGSVSGLSKEHRLEARRIVVQAAVLGLQHAAALHYTMGPQRWEGIQQKLVAANGKFPTHADCSSFVTWCLWNALHHRFNVRDTVNGQNWMGGYTGTMLQHGKPVHHQSNWLLGDCVIYGRPGSVGEHTAILVGDGWVISNGSEPGPFKLRWNYRPDVMGVRRYI